AAARDRPSARAPPPRRHCPPPPSAAIAPAAPTPARSRPSRRSRSPRSAKERLQDSGSTSAAPHGRLPSPATRRGWLRAKPEGGGGRVRQASRGRRGRGGHPLPPRKRRVRIVGQRE